MTYTSSAANPIDSAHLSDSFQRSLDDALQAPAPAPTPIRMPVASKAPAVRPSTSPKRRDSLEQTLELLAASEMFNDSDSLSETGVRHLKLEVQKKKSSRG